MKARTITEISSLRVPSALVGSLVAVPAAMLVVALSLLLAATPLPLPASARHPLPFAYTVCDGSDGFCRRVHGGLVLDGPRFDFDALNVTRFGADGVRFTVPGPETRLYVTDQRGAAHEQFYLKNRALQVTVDVSGVQCGYNAAFYFSNMKADSAIGTGYCDAQAYHSYFCNEFDVVEANIAGQVVTSHPCDFATGQCARAGCGSRTRDALATTFGPGRGIDTSRPFVVRTEFFTDDGTDDGDLSRVRQTLVQGGRMAQMRLIGEDECRGSAEYGSTGGMAAMSRSLDAGMTMIFSFWGTGGSGMSWLDDFPNDPDCNLTNTTVNEATFSKVKVLPLM